MQGADRSYAKADGWAGDSAAVGRGRGGGWVAGFFLLAVSEAVVLELTTATALMRKRSKSDRQPDGGMP